jgi:hypothetical protein
VPGVSIPIIDQLVHPSYSLVSSAALAGNPYSPSSFSVVPPQGVLALTYGIHWVVATAGAERGLKIGYPAVYEDRVLQVAVDYTFMDTSVHVTEWADLYAEFGTWWWAEPLPSHLYITVDPAVTLNLFYLQT